MDMSKLESLKIPLLVLKLKQGEKCGKTPILGFREFIYTEDTGAIGNMNANIEFCFHSVYGRTFEYLGVRSYYGHPDLISASYAFTHGGISAPCQLVHTSDDYFVGIKAMMEGYNSKIEPTVEAQKGREETFTAAMQLFEKFSRGLVSIL